LLQSNVRPFDGIPAHILLLVALPLRECRQASAARYEYLLEAIGEVLAALAAGDGAKAARIAETRLGLRSPGAAACNPAQAANTAAMAAVMAEFMPDNMRVSGFAMHEAASHLAGEAAKLQQSSELKPALGLLHKSREDARPAMPLID
jgi:hypothetical protein